jgi:Cu2+-containing amine oxidase
LRLLIEDFLPAVKKDHEERKKNSKREAFIKRGKTDLERVFISMAYDYVQELGKDARHMKDYHLWHLMNEENAFYEGWRSPLKVAATSQLSVFKTFEFFRGIIRAELRLPAEPNDENKKGLEL